MDNIQKTISKYVNYQLYDNLQKEWDQYRDLAKQKRCPKQVDKFLDSLIAGDLPTYLLKASKPLYRAQLFKQKDKALLGLNFNDIFDDAYTVVVGEELEVQSNSSFKLDAKNLYLMRKELISSAEVINAKLLSSPNPHKPLLSSARMCSLNDN